MKNGMVVTEKRVKAIGILKKEEMELPRFTKLMWGHEMAPKFARHFLTGLVKLGYVERKKVGEAEVYKSTGEGESVLASSQCGYCESKRMKVKLSLIGCRECGRDHWSCQKCSIRKVVVVGDFPKYRPALRECPR